MQVEQNATSPMEGGIGVFDSGVGGLSVLKEIDRVLPHEDLWYVADSAEAPYGEKSEEEIRQRSLELARFLVQRGAKALVVACNTATAAAAEELRAQCPVPVVAVEPAVKPAVALSCSGCIGVLATTGTLQSKRFQALLKRYAGSAEVAVQACPGLVERVEMGDLDGPVTRVLMGSYVQALAERGADTLVLGCTHYPFLRPLVRDCIGETMPVLDTGVAVARHLHSELRRLDLERPATRQGQRRFWTTGEPARCESVLGRLWGRGAIIVEHIAPRPLALL